MPAGWTSAVDPASGATYYISPQGVSSWERPGADAGAAAAGAAIGAAGGGAAAGAAAQTAAAAHPAAAAAFTTAPLPHGWKEETDPATGKKYYISPQGQSTWDRPAAENQPSFAPAVQAQVAQYRQMQEMTVTAPEKQHGYLAAVAKMRQAELVRLPLSLHPRWASPLSPLRKQAAAGMTLQQQQILAQGNFSSMEEAKAAKEWALAQLGPGQRAEVERPNKARETAEGFIRSKIGDKVRLPHSPAAHFCTHRIRNVMLRRWGRRAGELDL